MDKGEFRIALVLGGARSGKSDLALRLALSRPRPRLYVATAEAGDPEMAARIERHRRTRGAEWNTLEEPLQLPEAIHRVQGSYGVILVDCLTLWLSNLLAGQQPAAELETVADNVMVRTFHEPSPQERQARLEAACHSLMQVVRGAITPVVLVSNEVGWGIVPDNPLARDFRDWAGWLHQGLGQVADLVVLVVAGFPVVLKGALKGT